MGATLVVARQPFYRVRPRTERPQSRSAFPSIGTRIDGNDGLATCRNNHHFRAHRKAAALHSDFAFLSVQCLDFMPLHR
jgi:hypothetical protein